jgi:NAD(P)-dependent dehydrogenase (short-subunit alcohol dehydrogenase family)
MSATSPTIIVAGRNRDIGFEICHQLAGRSAQVVVTVPKPEAGGEAIRKLCRTYRYDFIRSMLPTRFV